MKQCFSASPTTTTTNSETGAECAATQAVLRGCKVMLGAERKLQHAKMLTVVMLTCWHFAYRVPQLGPACSQENFWLLRLNRKYGWGRWKRHSFFSVLILKSMFNLRMLVNIGPWDLHLLTYKVCQYIHLNSKEMYGGYGKKIKGKKVFKKNKRPYTNYNTYYSLVETQH